MDSDKLKEGLIKIHSIRIMNLPDSQGSVERAGQAGESQPGNSAWGPQGIPSELTRPWPLGAPGLSPSRGALGPKDS